MGSVAPINIVGINSRPYMDSDTVNKEPYKVIVPTVFISGRLIMPKSPMIISQIKKS